MTKQQLTFLMLRLIADARSAGWQFDELAHMFARAIDAMKTFEDEDTPV
jgi:hypothetical protein